jgi:hypothetical protein
MMYSVGKQDRMNSSPSKDTITGPGRYEAPKAKGTEISIGNAARGAHGHDKSRTPGPGTYGYNSTLEGPKYTMMRKCYS